MKAAALLLLGFLACAQAAGSDPTVSLPGVTDLTPDNYASEHTGKRAALIEFYAPWCGHCKSLVPEYTKLGQAIAADPKLKSRVLIAKVDADAHRSLGEKFGVRGFPTLKWFPRGKAADPVDYNGGRKVEDFLKFIGEQVAADAGFARVDALVPLAQKFQAAAADAKADLVKEAEAAAETVTADDKENAALYVRFMKKALEKGDGYIAAELERLTRMSEKPMSAAKLDQVSAKISILSSFTEAPEAAAEAAPAAAKEAEGEAVEADAAAAKEEEVALEDADEGTEEEEEVQGGGDDDEVYDDGLDDNMGAEEEEGEEHEGEADFEEGEGAPVEDDEYDDAEL